MRIANLWLTFPKLFWGVQFFVTTCRYLCGRLFEFEQEILSHGEDVEVLELAYLRERIEDHIIKMGQRYGLQLRKE